MVMGVLPNLLIIAILISNCTSAPNGAISFESIRYYVDDKFHDEIPEDYIYKTWGYRIADPLGREHTYRNKVMIPHGRKETKWCTIHRQHEVVKAHWNPKGNGYLYWITRHKKSL